MTVCFIRKFWKKVGLKTASKTAFVLDFENGKSSRVEKKNYNIFALNLFKQFFYYMHLFSGKMGQNKLHFWGPKNIIGIPPVWSLWLSRLKNIDFEKKEDSFGKDEEEGMFKANFWCLFLEALRKSHYVFVSQKNKNSRSCIFLECH